MLTFDSYGGADPLSLDADAPPPYRWPEAPYEGLGGGGGGRGALEGKGPQRRSQKRLGAVTVEYKCHRSGHLPSGRQRQGGIGWAPWKRGGCTPPFQCIPGGGVCALRPAEPAPLCRQYIDCTRVHECALSRAGNGPHARAYAHDLDSTRRGMGRSGRGRGTRPPLGMCWWSSRRIGLQWPGTGPARTSGQGLTETENGKDEGANNAGAVREADGMGWRSHRPSWSIAIRHVPAGVGGSVPAVGDPLAGHETPVGWGVHAH